ncbi:MAG: type I-C CRISPR-associated protein Cas7/Csd2 [Steroidobacteraceae bacterium]
MSLDHRYDFVLLFDVVDGNPNGDPDAGNLPRLDAETGRGLVTDVCLKRKVRNYIELVRADDPSYKIFVREKSVLNQQIESAYVNSTEVQSAVEAWQAWQKDKKRNPRPERHYEDLARDWMCANFFDVRTFGAVMSTGDEDSDSKLKRTAGQVRGPVQFTFARSVDPIVAQEHSITRMAVTNERDLEKERTMGRKHTVPYGLYVAHGFVSAFLAGQTGFSAGDLDLLWQALTGMFEHDRSAARGQMSTRGLYVFQHQSKLGNAPAHALFDRLTVRRKADVAVPRSYSDYEILFDNGTVVPGATVDVAAGVSLIRRC